MKNIRIKVKPDGCVYVSADTAVPLFKIEAFILKNAEWIKKHTTDKKPETDDFTPTPENGTALSILGETLVLELLEGTEERVEKVKSVLRITSSEPANEAHTERLILEYIADVGRKELSSYYDYFFMKSGYSGVKPALSLKMWKSKWGHCDHVKNEIALSFSLCCLPRHLAAYVAAHEVTHLLVPNHSAQFYRTGELIYPGFRSFDKEMRKYNTSLSANLYKNTAAL